MTRWAIDNKELNDYLMKTLWITEDKVMSTGNVGW